MIQWFVAVVETDFNSNIHFQFYLNDWFSVSIKVNLLFNWNWHIGTILVSKCLCIPYLGHIFFSLCSPKYPLISWTLIKFQANSSYYLKKKKKPEEVLYSIHAIDINRIESPRIVSYGKITFTKQFTKMLASTWKLKIEHLKKGNINSLAIVKVAGVTKCKTNFSYNFLIKLYQ